MQYTNWNITVESFRYHVELTILKLFLVDLAILFNNFLNSKKQPENSKIFKKKEKKNNKERIVKMPRCEIVKKRYIYK